jgi:3-oxoacyl-[acyl-carrier-protein] synthase II
MGAITPLGKNVAELCESQLEGRSGVGPIRHFDASTFRRDFAAVKDFDLALSSERRTLAAYRFEHAFWTRRRQAGMEDAGLLNNPKIDPTTIGAILARVKAATISNIWLKAAARCGQ